jgi:hypothetical protein
MEHIALDQLLKKTARVRMQEYHCDTSCMQDPAADRDPFQGGPTWQLGQATFDSQRLSDGAASGQDSADEVSQHNGTRARVATALETRMSLRGYASVLHMALYDELSPQNSTRPKRGRFATALETRMSLRGYASVPRMAL